MLWPRRDRIPTYRSRALGFDGRERIFGRERDGDAEPPCQGSVASYHSILNPVNGWRPPLPITGIYNDIVGL